MNLLEQDLLKRLQNCDVFGDNNRAAFAPTSRALPLFDELKTIAAQLQAEQSKQGASGGGAQGSTRAKATILGEFWRDMGKIEATARQMTALSDQEKAISCAPSAARPQSWPRRALLSKRARRCGRSSWRMNSMPIY